MPPARPRGFHALPPEMHELIMEQIDDLGTYVAFSRLCQSTRAVCNLFASEQPEGERRARELCLRAGFSRPKLFRHNLTWARLTCAIVGHAAKCMHCGECLKRSPAMLVQAQPVYAETRAATDVRLVTALRQSVGLYSIDWSRSTLRERPCLSLLRFDQTPANTSRTKPELVHHITMACRLAFTVPLQRVACGWEADDDWCFDGYSESIFEESEIGAEAPSALNYRRESVNEDGLTCLDLLVSAGDVPGLPVHEGTRRPLVYNGILDDQIRQGIVYIQGRT